MLLTKKRHSIIALSAALFSASAFAAFDDFIIRADPTILLNNTYVPNALEFRIQGGGQKAALGSSDVDGYTIGDLTNVAIIRHDDPTRFTAGSGPAVAPYLNFWITDGAGKYAVIANEPSDGNMQALYSGGWSLGFSDLADKAAKIYEVTDKSWLPNGGVGAFTFADFAGFTIKAPTVPELTVGWAGLGTGAPRELGTNQAYGVNWVFGDTLANYVSAPSTEGYVVSGASVTAVPEPEAYALALISLGIVGVAARRRRGEASAA